MCCAISSVSFGSYPYFKQGEVGTVIVLRSVDENKLEKVGLQFTTALSGENKNFEEEFEE